MPLVTPFPWSLFRPEVSLPLPPWFIIAGTAFAMVQRLGKETKNHHGQLLDLERLQPSSMAEIPAALARPQTAA
jgi:hypothetical protein